jgi:hypothetical protein
LDQHLVQHHTVVDHAAARGERGLPIAAAGEERAGRDAVVARRLERPAVDRDVEQFAVAVALGVAVAAAADLERPAVLAERALQHLPHLGAGQRQ